ncbi:hypothetical protein BJ741DRAFT_602045, partial [Chytriomyces cf. hyalinus JEL632]
RGTFIIWVPLLRTCCIRHACHSTDGIAEGKKMGKTGDRGMIQESSGRGGGLLIRDDRADNTYIWQPRRSSFHFGSMSLWGGVIVNTKRERMASFYAFFVWDCQAPP